MANSDEQQIEKTNSNPDLALYYLLHTNPVYQYVADEDNIHIMILGAGDWAQRFIGIALQTCQVVGRSVTITVACEEPENTKGDYLKKRPAVPKFVNVKVADANGKFGKGTLDPNKVEVYGTLQFVYGAFKNDEQDNNKIIGDLTEKFGTPQYVFIDLAQDDTHNYELAKTFANFIRNIDSTRKDFQFINYVVENETVNSSDYNPVPVKEEIHSADLEPLEQMAFNAHLSWFNTLNIDQIAERDKFIKDTYNYNSSLAFVLSIPYKLWSVGIQYENGDVASAAAKFQDELLGKKMPDSNKPEKLSEEYLKLIQLEHRRWVLEKICDNNANDAGIMGWQPGIIDSAFVADCIKRCSVKDKKQRIHPCLVRSTIEMPLKTRFYSEEPREGWKEPEGEGEKIDDIPVKDLKDLKFAYSNSNVKANISGFKKLDEMDQMSVQLHREFYKAAQVVIGNKPLENEESVICKIEELLSGENKDVKRAFNHYCYCIKNILAGNQTYSKQFENAQEEFKKALVDIVQNKKEVIVGKDKNVTGGLLQEVAKMLFPVIESNLYRDYKSLDEDLVNNIPFILTYKQVQELIIAFDDDRQGNGKNNAVFHNVASATVLNPQHIKYLYFYDKYTNEEMLHSKIRSIVSYLKKRIKGCKVTFVIAYQSLPEVTFFDKIVAEGVYIETQYVKDEKQAAAFFEEKLPACVNALYDGTNSVFKSARWNGLLTAKINEKMPYFEFDEFQDKHFTECNQCDFLQYIERSSVISKTYLRIEDMFSLMNAKNTKFNIPEFDTPDLANKYEKIWKICTGGLLENNPKVKPENRWEFGVRNWNMLSKTLENHQKDWMPNDTKVVEFTFNEKYAKKRKMFYNQYIDILKAMEEEGFVKVVEHDDAKVLENGKVSKVSLAFTTKEAKELMCTAGQILELFAYFEVLKTGFFDDVACSYEFTWENESVKNELDCVLTKGFKTIIVECKAVEKLKQDYYQKLYSLTNQFGIAEKGIILANTYDQREQEANEVMKKRGKLMDIITISEQIDIEEIGQNLCDIMEGKKTGKDFEVKKEEMVIYKP